MIRFTRIVKQLEVNFIVLIFETNLKKIIKPMTVLDRLNWSKLGQKFTNLLENLSIPSVSIIKDTCFNEYAEIAICTDEIWLYEKGDLNFNNNNEKILDFKFGSYKKNTQIMGPNFFRLMNNHSNFKKEIKKYLNLKKIKVKNPLTLPKKIELFSKKYNSEFMPKNYPELTLQIHL